MTDMKRLLEELEELRKENTALKGEKTDLQWQVQDLKSLCGQLQVKVKNLETEKREMTSTIISLKSEIKDLYGVDLSDDGK